MDNIFKPTKKDELKHGDFEGTITVTAWIKGGHKNDIIKDCHGNNIKVMPVSFLNDDNEDWKQADKLLKSYIGKLKNPVMIVKEFEHDFIKATTPNKVMKFAVSFKKKPSLRLGLSWDDSKILNGISDDFYYYQSDLMRLMIFEDSVENEKKMREIL